MAAKEIRTLEEINDKIKKGNAIIVTADEMRRLVEEDEKVRYFYKEYKNNPPIERYLLVAVKYLNSSGFVITSFFTNKITGSKWEMK